MKKSWQIINNCWFPKDTTSESKSIKSVVYSLEHDPKLGFYLKEVADNFKFDFKVYGLEREFIDRFVKTWRHSKGNLGALLNGVKGTGKTVTAEILANELKQPVIMIGRNYTGLPSFFADVHQDVTVLIDEFEKVFKDNIDEEVEGAYDEDGNYAPRVKSSAGTSLLSLMDGVYKTTYRRAFLLTTNEKHIDENLLNRPGRIRYLRNFSDLSAKVVEEIIDDCLVHKTYKSTIIDFLKPLNLITVDIVKSVVAEVNLFNEPAAVCCKDFNVELKRQQYSVYKITGKGKKELIESYVDGRCVKNAMNPKSRWRGQAIVAGGDAYYLAARPDYDKGIYPAKLDGMGTVIRIMIKKDTMVHSSYY